MWHGTNYIVSDQDTQFRDSYELWCDSHRIKPRFGALGQHGSIAVIERFNRTLKDELVREILVPLRLTDFNDELIRYVVWYNEHRLHQALHGRTPNEVSESRSPARDGPRLKPHPNYPSKAGDGNQTSTSARRATNLHLIVKHLDDRRHLPIVSINQAASRQLGRPLEIVALSSDEGKMRPSLEQCRKTKSRPIANARLTSNSSPDLDNSASQTAGVFGDGDPWTGSGTKIERRLRVLGEEKYRDFRCQRSVNQPTEAKTPRVLPKIDEPAL